MEKDELTLSDVHVDLDRTSQIIGEYRGYTVLSVFYLIYNTI